MGPSSANLGRLARELSAASTASPSARAWSGVPRRCLTFVILCAFALIVGSLTVHRIRSDFNREVAADAADLAVLLQIGVSPSSQGYVITVHPNLDEYAAPDHAAIKVLTDPAKRSSHTLLTLPTSAARVTPASTATGSKRSSKGTRTPSDYRVESVEKQLPRLSAATS